jgi:hypothetical protein
MAYLVPKFIVLLVGYFLSFTTSACVPDFPEKLLSDPLILEHPSIATAFEQVQQNLSALYVNTTRDGMSFAIVRNSWSISTLTQRLWLSRSMHQVACQHTHSTMALLR